MPKDKGSKKRGTTVLCKCQSHCLKFNPQSQRFEGQGQHIPERTRTRHRRDDRLRRLLQTRDANPGPLPLRSDHDRGIPDNEWMDLIDAQLDLLADIPAPDINRPLEFSNNPADFGPYQVGWSHPDNQGLGPNAGAHSLRPNSRANAVYLQHENKVWEIYRTLCSFEDSDRRDGLKERALACLQALEQAKETHWAAQRNQLGTRSRAPVYYNEPHFNRVKPAHPVIQAAGLSCLVLQYIFAASRRALSVHLGGIRDTLSSAPGVSPALAEQVPKDPRTLLTMFRVDPSTSTFLVCITCHALYPFSNTGPQNRQPQVCRRRKALQSPECGTSLWKEVDRGPLGQISMPVRKYLHQGLRSWIGSMLARPGIEDMLESRPHAPPSSDPLADEIDDIWLSTEFRKLKDVTGAPYYPGPDDELRLVFSFSVDGFNPFGNKTAKQISGSTGIWMVLLNLPKHERYLQHNIYTAGVIPGPNKPSNEEINSYIQLVVDDLKPFWSTGVYYSKTYKYRGGRLVRAIVVPLICDLLAARQVIGYPGSTTAHYFCTACDLDIDDINIVDPTFWPPKDDAHTRRCAASWRDAPTTQSRGKIFEAFGWRWSPLLQLEYWSPSRYTVIDSMHSLDLNLLQNHCRSLFQIDLKHPGSDALRAPRKSPSKRVVSNPLELRALRQCQELIALNPPELLYKLLEFHRKVLYSLCLDYDIRSAGSEIVVGTRWVLAKNIYLWRQTSDNPTLLTFLRVCPNLSPAQMELQNQSEDDGDELEDRPEHGPPPVPSTSAAAAGSGAADTPAQQTAGKLPSARVLSQMVIAISDPNTRTESLYNRLKASILEHFFDILGLDKAQALNEPSRGPKRKLWDRLVFEITERPELIDQLKGVYNLENNLLDISSHSAFLGKDVMEAVWADMKRSKLPSWMTPVPVDWGTPRRGKLSADNWRVISCVHLVITLIRLFGQSTGRKRDLLDNFMDLVAAVRTATMQRSSRAQIDKYNFYMLRYSRRVKELYPDYEVLPSHHAALHIGDMLSRFGPKHAHDSPHYERYIHFFHYQNTNQKLGELEATLLRVSARCANIRHLVNENPETRRLFFYLLDRMKLIEKERLRGFRLLQMFAPLDDSEAPCDQQTLLEEADYLLLCEELRSRPSERNVEVSRVGTYLKAVSLHGTTYFTWRSRHRDSAVVFNLTSDPSQIQAGIIRKIFYHRHIDSAGIPSPNHYILIDAYTKFRPELDVYRAFGFAAGFSCGLAADGLTPMLVPLRHIVSQVVLTEFADLKMTHILPVNKEMLSLETLVPLPGSPDHGHEAAATTEPGDEPVPANAAPSQT